MHHIQRIKLENDATDIMYNKTSLESLKLYLEGDFLAWMRSRNNRERFKSNIVNLTLTENDFEIIKSEDNLNREQIHDYLSGFCETKGIGPVLSTAILTLINPKQYGIVCNYTIQALNKFDNPKNYKLETKKHAVDAIIRMKEIAKIIGKDIDIRDVDKALWGYGKQLNEQK